MHFRFQLSFLTGKESWSNDTEVYPSLAEDPNTSVQKVVLALCNHLTETESYLSHKDMLYFNQGCHAYVWN